MTGVEVVRGANVLGALRGLNVVIGGVTVGKLMPKKSQTFPLSPGKHTVVVKMDWASSAPFEVNLVEGETVRLIAKQTAWALILSVGLGLIGALLLKFGIAGYTLEVDSA